MLRTTRALAGAAAVAVLAAGTLLVIWVGSGAVADPATALRLARFMVLLAVPGVALAVAAPHLDRRWRLLAAVAGAAALVAAAVWQREAGGVLLAPAAILLLAAGLPTAPAPPHDLGEPPRSAQVARGDLVVAAALAAVVGVVGRAVTLDDVGAGARPRLSVAVSGLVVLAWPLVGPALLPARLRHRALVVAAAVLTALVVLREPAGGEAWLVPGTVLLLVAALTDPVPEPEERERPLKVRPMKVRTPRPVRRKRPVDTF